MISGADIAHSTQFGRSLAAVRAEYRAAMKRAAAAFLFIVGVVLVGFAVFALGAAALDPTNPFNGFNIAYGLPALALGSGALIGAVMLWRSRRRAAPPP